MVGYSNTLQMIQEVKITLGAIYLQHWIKISANAPTNPVVALA